MSKLIIVHRMDKINLLYFPDSIEIASLEGLMLWFPEIKGLECQQI